MSERDPGIKKIFVHASPYSIAAYTNLGFYGTDNLHEENGIKYLPMEKTIIKEM